MLPMQEVPDEGDPELAEYLRQVLAARGQGSSEDLRRLETDAAEIERRRWPELLAYETACRKELPIPEPAGFSDVERRQYALLSHLVKGYLASPDGRCLLRPTWPRALLLGATPVGLAALRDVFAGEPVFLFTQSEQQRWMERISTQLNDLWQYQTAWWNLFPLPIHDDEVHRWASPPPESPCPYFVLRRETCWGRPIGDDELGLWTMCDDRLILQETFPSTGSVWYLDWGTRSGSLCGGGRSALMLWNGREFTELRDCGRWIS